MEDGYYDQVPGARTPPSTPSRHPKWLSWVGVAGMSAALVSGGVLVTVKTSPRDAIELALIVAMLPLILFQSSTVLVAGAVFSSSFTNAAREHVKSFLLTADLSPAQEVSEDRLNEARRFAEAQAGTSGEEYREMYLRMASSSAPTSVRLDRLTDDFTSRHMKRVEHAFEVGGTEQALRRGMWSIYLCHAVVGCTGVPGRPKCVAAFATRPQGVHLPIRCDMGPCWAPVELPSVEPDKGTQVELESRRRTSRYESLVSSRSRTD